MTGRPAWAGVIPVAAIAVVFIASRVAVAFAGVRFDASTLAWFWQYLDPELLRNDLAESLLYLHAQPPLFNLLLGIALKVAPEHYPEVLHGAYLTFSAAGALGGYLLLLRLGLSRPTSAVVIAVCLLSPAWLLYENWLFYEHLVAMALILSGFALHRYLASPSVSRSLVFFTLLAGIALTRSLFHPIWLLMMLAIVVLSDFGAWRTTAIGAAAPYAVVLLIIAKNLVLFGLPGMTSWTGSNLARLAVASIPPEERQGLVARDVLSPASLIPPFSSIEEYGPVVAPQPPTGVAALDALRKPTTGVPNFNHSSMISVSGLYLRDAWAMVQTRPTAYAETLVEGARVFIRPSTAYYFLLPNRESIGAYDRAVGAYVFLRGEESSPTVLAAYLLSWLYGALLLLSARRTIGRTGPTLGTLLFLWVTVMWVAGVANLTEFGENHRFRYLSDALVVVLLAHAAHHAYVGGRSIR